MPKKKAKSSSASSPPKETKSKFYVTKDNKSVNDPPPVVIAKKKTKREVAKAPVEEPKTLERSNSFILTRTLSKIYTKLSGSKENLDKARDSDEKPVAQAEVTPFKFQRSLTLNSFQLKKNYRKTLPEMRLEKLSEEMIGEKSPPMSPPVTIRSRSPANFRQSMPPGSFDSVDFCQRTPPPLERSGSFISIIRRKISFNDAKPAPLTSNWATSMQNLRQIDNMVSYEDLSFVDYDKFNQYEQQIDKMLARLRNKRVSPPRPIETVNASVVRRREKKSSTRLMGDFNSNLDREKNLYRQSIDSNKLRFLSSIILDSHRWSQIYDNPIDWLSLDNAPPAAKAIS